MRGYYARQATVIGASFRVHLVREKPGNPATARGVLSASI